MIEGSDQAFSQVIKSSSHATFGQQNISYTFDWTQKLESFPATNKTLIPFHNFRCSTGVPNSRNGLEYRIISMIPGIIPQPVSLSSLIAELCHVPTGRRPDQRDQCRTVSCASRRAWRQSSGICTQMLSNVIKREIPRWDEQMTRIEK